MSHIEIGSEEFLSRVRDLTARWIKIHGQAPQKTIALPQPTKLDLMFSQVQSRLHSLDYLQQIEARQALTEATTIWDEPPSTDVATIDDLIVRLNSIDKPLANFVKKYLKACGHRAMVDLSLLGRIP